MKSTRQYQMGARAAAVAQTRQRILDAALSLSATRRIAALSLDDIASEAEVSVQTVLRQFGSRAGVLEAAAGHARAAVREERRTPVGDVEAAVSVLMEHYEQRGRATLLLLGQEDEDPMVAAITTDGKALHRAWVCEAFAPYTDDDAVIDLLVVATDVYAWKLLRLDRGLSRAVTEQRMKHLVAAILAATGPKESS